ncbi:MAG TPA: type II secretion system protein [Candidatus Saccharimonadales bacterium]|nr:type II secretion system protein [Candidatus Saccharimonadales bacterium]
MGGLLTTGRLLERWRASRAPIFRPLQKRERGFTIVEVLIVLGISGALFVAAAILISGKQNQASFNQAIQQMQSQVQQVVNEVANGYFPSNANFQCTANAGGPVVLSSVGANAQGANAGCVFAGKVLQFKVAGTDPEKYNVFTLAGAQKDSTGKEVTTLSASVPKVIAPYVGAASGFPDITSSTVLQNGLTVAATGSPAGGMWYSNGGGDIAIGAVAFVPSFASYTGSTIDSTSQQVSVIAINSTSTNTDAKTAATAINSNVAGGVVNPSGGVSVCFASGGTDQSGLLTIGGGAHPLSVTMKVMQGTKTCGK